MGKDQSQIRIKSEISTVKHVEALKFFFLKAQISSIVFLNVKNLAFTPYCVCVCVFVCVCVCVVVVGGGGGVWGGGGGGAGSRRYNHSNIYHDPAISYSITCVDRCWRVGQWLQIKCITLS